jgi:outer membrane protein assembly factor BamB
VSFDSAGRERWSWHPTVKLAKIKALALAPGDRVIVSLRGELAALSLQTGNVVWELSGASPNEFFEQLVMAPDGSLYAAYGSGQLQAVSMDGKTRWAFDFKYRISSLAVDDEGRVYVCVGGKLFAYSPGGERLWSYGRSGAGKDFVSLGPDGTVYATGDSQMEAITREGALLWQTKSTQEKTACGRSGLAFGENGNVYFGCTDRVFAYSSKGEPLWDYNINTGSGIIRQPPAVGRDGTVYVAGGALCALSPQGQVKWCFQPGLKSYSKERAFEDNPAASSPWIAPDGTILFGCQQNRIYALTPDGRLRWAYRIGPDDVSVSPTWGFVSMAGLVLTYGQQQLIAFPIRDATLQPSGRRERSW